MAEALADNWLILVVIGGVILVVAFGFHEDAPVMRRVFKQFVIGIVFPLVVILGAPLLFLGLRFELDERIWAALIAGVVIATGWLTSTIFTELARARDKAERLRDYHKALYAEIGNTLQVFWDRGQAEGEARRIVELMESDKTFIPLIPREHHDFVYNSLIEDIEVLPRVTIDVVVAYYSLIKANAAQAEDMRGARFSDAKLGQNRRIQMYKDYFETRKSAFQVGQHALRLITEFADNGPKAAAQLSKSLNTPDAGQSGPSQESA